MTELITIISVHMLFSMIRDWAIEDRLDKIIALLEEKEDG